MATKIYVDNDKFLAGMSMKDTSELEHRNLALHACENAENIDFVCANQTRYSLTATSS